MATKQTKFGTYLGPPEIEVKQSQVKFSQHYVFSFQLKQICLDCFNVKAIDLCCQTLARRIYSLQCDSIWHCVEFACKQEPVRFRNEKKLKL